MKIYNVLIKEILERSVEVKANNEEEAIDEARKLYGNCEVILDWDDLGKVTFEIDEEQKNKNTHYQK